jgi:outer membrane protein assembly factor BamA
VDGVLEEVWTPLGASLVIPFRELYRQLDLSVGWRGTFYRALGSYQGTLPLPNGFRSLVTASVDYDDTRQFVNSISRIMGVQVGLFGGVTARALGSDYEYVLGEAALNAYLRIPYTRQWVLAFHLAYGTSQGDFGGQYPFSLGGVPSPDVTAMLLTALGFATAGAQPNQLRGYPSGLFTGSHLVSGTAELRFPIWDPQWGISTWPIYLRRLYGGVFLDSGIAWVPVRDYQWWQRLRFGAGVELRVQLVVGFYVPFDVRVGVARGLGAWLAPGHPSDPYAVTQVYVTLGQSF